MLRLLSKLELGITAGKSLHEEISEGAFEILNPVCNYCGISIHRCVVRGSKSAVEKSHKLRISDNLTISHLSSYTRWTLDTPG